VSLDALIGPAGWRTIARKTSVLGTETQIGVPQAGSRRVRIAVSETETYSAPAWSGAPTSRLVYADTVDITVWQEDELSTNGRQATSRYAASVLPKFRS
jgi:hypothetical protein